MLFTVSRYSTRGHDLEAAFGRRRGIDRGVARARRTDQFKPRQALGDVAPQRRPLAHDAHHIVRRQA
jgi:hypothetical protein